MARRRPQGAPNRARRKDLRSGEARLTLGANYDQGIEPIDLGIQGLTNVERIGAGGNAIVYRARQADLDRDVVVKVLTTIDEETTRRRFDRERRAMGRLSQAAGIAPLYGSGFTTQGRPYLLMPFYAMGSLQDQLERAGALQPAEVRNIGVMVARAVQTAHENGVLHRDLKPANILLRKSGEPDVADFGIAHLTDDALGTSQALTLTPLYTAPEVFDGVESGAVSDVYSVGATLFALLNGRPAYSDPGGGTPVLSLMRRINEDPLPAFPDSVPTPLAAVIAKAMSKDPGNRQPSAGDLAAELRAVDLTTPVPVPKAGPSRNMLIAAGALVVALLGGAGLAFALANRSDSVSSNDPTSTAVAGPSVEPGDGSVVSNPIVTPDGDDGTPGVFDAVAATAAARQAVVRVETYGCTGANVTTGVVLNDGIVVTRDRALSAPWLIEVSASGEVRRATPQAADASEGLAFLTIEEGATLGTDAFVELPGVQVAPGDQVAIVGRDGRPAMATILLDPADSSILLAEVVERGSGNIIEPLDIIVTDSGGLVGIAEVSTNRIEVVTPDRIQSPADPTPPSYACQSLSRDLQASDTEAAVSPAIAELLGMQQLSDAYANEQWDLVRRLEADKQAYTDANFINGWRPLRQGFVYPVDRSVEAGLSQWRIGLIGHETWNGNDLTTLFCVTWTVNPVSGVITQTNQDNVVVYGSQTGQPQRSGFVDPADLRSLIDENCAL